MDVFLFVVLYLAVGLLVGLYAYVRGVKSRPTPKVFSVEDSAVVVLAAAVVGLVWVLFMPVLIGRGGWLAFKWLEHRWAQLPLRRPRVVRRLT